MVEMHSADVSRRGEETSFEDGSVDCRCWRRKLKLETRMVARDQPQAAWRLLAVFSGALASMKQVDRPPLAFQALGQSS